MLCEAHGHEVIALGNLFPKDDATQELDSYMYQTVGHQMVAAISTCAGLPLFRRRLSGSSKEQVSLAGRSRYVSILAIKQCFSQTLRA